MKSLVALIAVLAVAGCDLGMVDPNVARIEAVTVDAPPSDAGDALLFTRLTAPTYTPTRSVATPPSARPFPVEVALPSEFVVETSDGTFSGETLIVELRACQDATCVQERVLGEAEIQPDGWPGTQRTVDVGGARVTLTYRRTTS